MALSQHIFILALALSAFLTVLAIVPMARKLAVKYDFTDQPGGRKKHDDAVPLIGGLIIFPMFLLFSAFLIDDWRLYGPLYGAVAILLITGAWDDRFHLRARYKFMAQIAAAALVVLAGNTYVGNLGDLFGFGIVWLGPFKQVFAIVAVVLLINGVNLMDGLDGLAGGIGFIITAILATIAFISGHFDFAGPLAVATAVLAGFLYYNMRRPGRERAVIFMGDAGSLVLGLFLGWACLHMAQGHTRLIEPISVAWLLALPIIDTCGQFARRMLQGRHPFDPDYHHFHYHFITAGVPHGRAVLYVLATSAICGLVGVTALPASVPYQVLTYGWIALLFGHIYLSLRPRRFRRLIQRYLYKKSSVMS